MIFWTDENKHEQKLKQVVIHGPATNVKKLFVFLYLRKCFFEFQMFEATICIFTFYRMRNQVPLMKRDDQIMNSLARESANPIIERQLVTFYDEEEAN